MHPRLLSAPPPLPHWSPGLLPTHPPLHPWPWALCPPNSIPGGRPPRRLPLWVATPNPPRRLPLRVATPTPPHCLPLWVATPTPPDRPGSAPEHPIPALLRALAAGREGSLGCQMAPPQGCGWCLTAFLLEKYGVKNCVGLTRQPPGPGLAAVCPSGPTGGRGRALPRRQAVCLACQIPCEDTPPAPGSACS